VTGKGMGKDPSEHKGKVFWDFYDGSKGKFF